MDGGNPGKRPGEEGEDDGAKTSARWLAEASGGGDGADLTRLVVPACPAE